MFDRLKAFAVMAMAAAGITTQGPANGEPSPVAQEPGTPLARAFGPRSMFPRRRTYVLPFFPGMEPDFWAVREPFRSDPLAEERAEQKRRRKAAKWLLDVLATEQGRERSRLAAKRRWFDAASARGLA